MLDLPVFRKKYDSYKFSLVFINTPPLFQKNAYVKNNMFKNCCKTRVL